jgi:elongation factor G
VLGVRLRVVSYKAPKRFSEHTYSLIKIAIISGIKSYIKGHTEEIGPITLFEVLTPEKFLGQVLSGIQMRKGRVLTVESREGKVSYLKGEALTENLLGFAGVLRNMTKGKGTISMVTLFNSQKYGYV